QVFKILAYHLAERSDRISSLEDRGRKALETWRRFLLKKSPGIGSYEVYLIPALAFKRFLFLTASRWMMSYLGTHTSFGIYRESDDLIVLCKLPGAVLVAAIHPKRVCGLEDFHVRASGTIDATREPRRCDVRVVTALGEDYADYARTIQQVPEEKRLAIEEEFTTAMRRDAGEYSASLDVRYEVENALMD